MAFCLIIKDLGFYFLCNKVLSFNHKVMHIFLFGKPEFANQICILRYLVY